MKIVETVAFHFKKTAHFKTGVVRNDIIHLFFRFFKIFASMLTFFFAWKPYKIGAFTEIIYIKFLVISASESKNLLSFNFKNLSAYKLIDVFGNFSCSSPAKINLWKFFEQLEIFMSTLDKKYLILSFGKPCCIAFL